MRSLTCPFLQGLVPHSLGPGGGALTLTGGGGGGEATGGGGGHFLTQVQPYLPFSLTQVQPDAGGGGEAVGEGTLTTAGGGGGGGLHGTAVQTFLP